MPSNVYIENYHPDIREAGGILTKKNFKMLGGAGVFDISAAASANFGTVVPTITGANIKLNAVVNTTTPVAINSTATATAAQIASGYITSTSGAATTITLPTATAIATQIGAAQGTIFELWIDNTAGANTVTITPDSSMTKSQVAQVATYGVPTFGLFTVASGVTGQGCFCLAFSSATACTIARVF